jgi:hypothetical protein
MVNDDYSDWPFSLKDLEKLQTLTTRSKNRAMTNMTFLLVLLGKFYVHISTIFRNQFNIQYFIKLDQDIYQTIKHNFMIFIIYH